MTSGDGAPVVRQASEKDSETASRVLAAAFEDYAWTTWTVDQTDHLARVAALQRLALTELVLPFGEAWVVIDDGHMVSVAAWMRADRPVPDRVAGARTDAGTTRR